MSYGIRVAKPGYNAETCADFETALDSRFPNEKIAFEGSFITTASVSSQTLVTHNLGYAPVFYMYIKDEFISGSGNTTMATTGYSQFFRINGTNLIYDGGLGEIIEGYYYIIHQRIDQNITYATISNTPTTLGTITNNYGIDVAKAGIDVTTASPKDLAWSSQYPSPIIHKMVTGTLTSGVDTTVSHGLSYFPQYYLFIFNVFGDGRWQSVFNSFDLVSYCNNTNIVFNFNGFDPTYTYGLLIRKSPIRI